MRKQLRLLLIIIALFLFACVVFHFRLFIFFNVIEPLALVIWTLWNLMSSIDQKMCWGGVILLCVMITFRLIPSSEARIENPAYTYESRPQSQFDYWQRLVERGGHDRLRSDLKTLLMKVIAKSNHYQASESDEANISHTTLSLEAQEYLLNSRRKPSVFQRYTWHSLKSFLPGMFQWLGKKMPNKEERVVNEVIQWMETELDIGYEK